MSELTHYFNADEYNELGYQKAVSLTQSIVYPKMDAFTQLTKYITLTSVDFFDFGWLDTSAISIIDLGRKFTNYKVDETQKQELTRSTDVDPVLMVDYFQARV